MSKNFREVSPLNWQELVAEALRRRKIEKITQRQHAALAGVSIPTILAFDRCEHTLSLAKTFDILRVVGLVEERSEDGAQELFVKEAFERWLKLTAKLPQDSPGRFPDGWYRIDYVLEGDLKHISLDKFLEILVQAELPLTGWPVFWIPTRKEFVPCEIDGAIECWLPPSDENHPRISFDAAHCDFWRATPEGRMFLIRGYQEDSQETFAPRRVFDTGLPIWRLGEALLHAARLSKLMKRKDDSEVTIRFRALYTGLSGRILKAWANPLANLQIEGGVARGDEAMIETVVTASAVERDLVAIVLPLVGSLYERFGVSELSADRLRAEIQLLQSGRISRRDR